MQEEGVAKPHCPRAPLYDSDIVQQLCPRFPWFCHNSDQPPKPYRLLQLLNPLAKSHLASPPSRLSKSKVNKARSWPQSQTGPSLFYPRGSVFSPVIQAVLYPPAGLSFHLSISPLSPSWAPFAAPCSCLSSYSKAFLAGAFQMPLTTLCSPSVPHGYHTMGMDLDLHHWNQWDFY